MITLGRLTDTGKPFVVPLELATQGIGILGQRGAGKSNTEVVIAERFYEAGVPWLAIDPKGDWYGIRSSADGTGPGLPIPVLGGLHGDATIEASDGAAWAEVLVEQNLSAVVDVSDFSKNDRARFLVAFFERLYRLHRQDPQVRHVFLEEAHEYIPQQVGREDGRLKEAAARLVLQGRSFGLGTSACSQRSARLHKDVLTQIGTLIAHRTTGPQDRKAIEAWVVEHDIGREMIASLPELDSGEAWVWSPEFLGTLVRVRFDRRSTFDSGATPLIGAASRAPRTLADVDLAAIKDAMAESIERADAKDPVKLAAKLARAEARIAELEAWTPPPPPAPIVVEVSDQIVAARDRIVESLAAVVADAHALSLSVDGAVPDVADQLAARRTHQRAEKAIAARKAGAPAPRAEPAAPRAPAPPAARGVAPANSSELRGSPAKVLAVLARAYPDALPARRAGRLAGIPARKSTFRNACSALRKAGLIEGSGEDLRATAEGVAVADIEAIPTGPEALAYWRGKIGREDSANRRLFEVLLAAYPRRLDADEMADAAGIPRGASTLRNAKSALRALSVMEGDQLAVEFMEAIS